MDYPSRVTIQTYDEVAETYARRNADVSAAVRRDIAAFAQALGPGAVVADVGCGPGRDSRLLRHEGLEVVGVDMSLGMLAAQVGGPVVCADMRALPLRPGVCSGLWCQAAVLHVPRHQVAAVFGEFARVVRPGGVLHLSVAEGDGDGWEHGAYGSTGSRWFVRHRMSSLEPALAEAGFADLDVERSTGGRDWLGAGPDVGCGEPACDQACSPSPRSWRSG